MRVALVHECVAGFHGSERVLAALAELYPEAPIFVLIHQTQATRGTVLAEREIRCSLLDRLPLLRDRHRLLLPLMPYAVEQHDLRGFDVVISSHHAVAHGVLTRSDQMHVCYTHSPARYAWELYHEHVPPGRFSPIKRWMLHRFRVWDATAGQRVDHFIANSKPVANRILKVYRREATVIHPPVDVSRFDAGREREDFYLVSGRLVGYKHVAAVVEAMNAMGRRLIVIGDGPERRRLQQLAGPTVTLLGEVDDAAVADHMGRCRALLFAGEEDFGIVPVEALASGAPVLALGRGGAAEVVADGRSGLLFPESTPEAVRGAVERFERDGVALDAAGLSRAAARYAPERFKLEMGAAVGDAWQRFRERRL